MSRKYRAKDKKVYKMTKDGVVEINKATGGAENISRREADFLLRKQQESHDKSTGDIKKQPEKNDLRNKHKSPQYRTSEQPVSAHTTNTAEVTPPNIAKSEVVTPTAEITKVAAEEPPKTIKATDRSYEAGTSPPPKNRAYISPHSAGETKPPITNSTEHSGQLRFSDNINPAPPPAKQSRLADEPVNSNRLQFTKDSRFTPARNVVIPRQTEKNHSDNNKYQQRFTPEAAKPQTQTISEEPKIDNTTVQDKSQTENAERPYTREIPQAEQPPNTVRKLYFNKNNKLSSIPKKLKPRQNAENSVSDIKNNYDFTQNKSPEKIQPQTDLPPTKLLKKSGKLKFTAVKINTENVKSKKYKRRVEPKSETTEIKPVSDDKKPDKVKLPVQKSDEAAKKSDKSGRLKFTSDEKTLTAAPSNDKKLVQLQKKSDKSHTKLEKARDKLPSKKLLKETRTFDEKKGKEKEKLQFEKEILPPGSQKPITPAPISTVKKGADGITRMGANKLHQKVYEVEHENVGTKAAHRVEQAAETVYQGGKRVTRSAFRYVRNRPYRTVEKLEKKAVQADMRLSYRKALNENPKLKKNMLSRYMQKRKIRNQYAKAAREAKRTAETAKKTGDITVRAAKAIGGAIKRHPVAAAIVIFILLIIFFLASLFSAFGGMAGSGVPAFLSSTYFAQDADINQAELAYTEWETDLRQQIQNAESDYPGYNEYRYNIDGISHNSHELIAFLTAVYGEFQYAEIETVLRQIFSEQYQLSFTPSVEIRYYENEDEELIPYDWNVLTVTLTSRLLPDVLSSHMDSDQTMLYDLLTMSGGNRQYVGSPFAFDWRSNVTSKFGYRVHPITGAKDFHKGTDIAVPVGTYIHSAQDGIVTFAGWNDSYGYYVVVENSAGLVTKYAHCDSLTVSTGQEVKAGDLIAKSGNTGDSTGAHLHFEVIMGEVYLDPYMFAMPG